MDQLLNYPAPAAWLWAMLALLAAGAVFWLARRKGPVLAPAWVAIGLLIAAAMIPVAGLLRSFTPYFVQVDVLRRPGEPLDGVKVWSSAEGEIKRDSEGWEMKIPASLVPDNGTVIIWAALDAADLTHSQAVVLKNNHRPKVTIPMTGDRSAKVAGRVRDQDGRPVGEALISLVDSPEGIVMSEASGRFALPVYAEKGEQVRIQVALPRRIQTEWVTAGDESLLLTVERR